MKEMEIRNSKITILYIVLLIEAILIIGCAGKETLPTEPGIIAQTVSPQLPLRGFFMGVLPTTAKGQSFDDAYAQAARDSEFVPVWGKPSPFYNLATDLSGNWGKVFIKQFIIGNGMFPIIHLSFIGSGMTLVTPPGMKNATLSDPAWRTAYKQAAIDVVKVMHPIYLSLGNEVNRWYEKYGKEGTNGFINYVSLYEETYDAVKKLSPETKVFCVFAREIVSENREADLEVLRLFNPSKIDLLVFTSYPYALGKTNPSMIPDDYYSKAADYMPGKPFGFSEVAWASFDALGGEQAQADFIVQVTGRLTRSRGLNLHLFGWPWLHDLNDNDAVGLIKTDGTEKLGYAIWKSISRKSSTSFRPYLLAQDSSGIKGLVAPLTIWEKQFDNNGNADAATDVVEGTDGNFVIVGATGPIRFRLGYSSDGMVIKIDPDGNLLWKRHFGDDRIDLFSSVIIKEDNYIIVGCKTCPPHARQAWLLELDPNGNIVKEKTFGGNYDDGAADIISTIDNGYLVIGQTKVAWNRQSDVWLIKLNSDFEIVWTKTYDLGNEDTGLSIAPIGNKNFIIIANTYTKNYGSLFQQGFSTYMVVDQDGNILKKQTFDQGPKNKFNKIKPTSDGGAIIVGATSIREKFPSEDTWIIKLDNNADVVWTRVFNSYGRYDGGFNIIQTSDDGYIVTAYSQIEQTPQMNFDNFWLLRLKSTGETLWSHTWGGPDNDDLFSIIYTSDGAYLLVGVKGAVSWPLDKVPGPSDFYVIKITDTKNYSAPVLKKL
ncbi:MAG: hypothetical protein ACPL7B_06270 [Candidatus Poribacteria bacterium]